MARKKKFNIKDFKVSPADRAANPGKSSLDIVNARTGSKNPNQRPAVLTKSGSSRKVGSSPTQPITSFQRSTPQAAALGGAVASTPNAGIDLINQRQFQGTQQFQQQVQDPSDKGFEEIQDRSQFDFQPSQENQDQAARHRIESAKAQQEIYKPNGWNNVSDVLLLALNPFSKDSISANTGNNVLDQALQLGANNPYVAALIAAGAITAGGAIASSLTGGGTAVSQAGTLGTSGITTATGLGTSAFTANIVTNTLTTKATASLVTKLAIGSGLVGSVTAITGTVMAVLGTYPFAGFVQEEALQTIGFATSAAIRNGDLDGAERAIAVNEEILDPGFWDSMKAKVPLLNIKTKLDDFNKAARIKLDVDKQVLTDLRTKENNNETMPEMYSRIDNQKQQSEQIITQQDNEYWDNIKKRNAEAKAADRAADEKYWANILSQREEEEKKKRKETEDYWTEYYKSLANYQKNSSVDPNPGKSTFEAPSNLKFGLL